MFTLELADDTTPAPTAAVSPAAGQLVCPAGGGECFFMPAQAPASTRSATLAIVGAVALAALGLGIAAIHGNWAYGDWTCAFKTCVAVAPVRRRKRK
jgi:hypothetical protein